MNAVEIIKLFRVIFMPVTEFSRLKISYFAKGGHFGSFVNAGGFSKKPTAKIKNCALSKKGREKSLMAQVVKSSHQLTWAQKSVTKKRVNF